MQRATMFLLLPLYTRAMAPEEYGRLAVVLTISAGVSTLLSFGLETAVFRTFILLRKDLADRERFVNSVGLVALLGPACLAAAGLVIFGDALAALFGVPHVAIALAIALAAVQVSVTVLPFALLRAQERLGKYLQLTAIQVGLTASFTVIFVVVLEWGMVGWLGASLISMTATLGAGIVILEHRWTLRLDRRQLLEALAYGIPLLPHAAAHWGLSLSDRLIMGASVASNEIGLYQLAYAFAIPVSTVAVAMSRGTAPIYAHAVHSESDRSQIAGLITHHVLVTALIGTTVAVLGPAVIKLLMPPEYAGAAAFVPWLALGSVFLGLYFVPMNVIAILAGDTRYAWIATLVAAVANIGLNLWLVPRYGAIAAAVNFAVGYAALLAGVMLFMRATRQGIGFEWKRIAIGLAIVAAVAVCGILLTRELEAWPALVIGGSVALAAPVLLVLAGVWRRPRSGRADHSNAGSV